MTKKRARNNWAEPTQIANRWRMLLPEQQEHVFNVLSAAFRRSTLCAKRAATKASHIPEPFSKHQRNLAMKNSAMAGAVRIVNLLLGSIGCVDDKRPRSVLPSLCPQCQGHSRQICDCVPRNVDTVDEMVGQVGCVMCHGDGDIPCPNCDGRGAILEVV